MMTLYQLRKSREINEGQDISVASIARKIDVSRQQYRRYEKGLSVPNFLEAAKIAAYYNLKLTDLLEIVRATLGPEDE